MRIQFGRCIRACKFVSHSANSTLMNAATDNGLYTIAFDTVEEADAAYKQVLEKGYYDATNNQYSNM